MSFKQLDIKFDVSRLCDYLQSCSLWDANPLRRTAPGSPHSQMTDIWARFGAPNGDDYSVLGKEHDAVWYPFIDQLPDVKDIAFKLMALVNGERLGGVLITKLPAGSKIAPHVDDGWHAGYYDKIYVPIKNEKGSVFGFECGNIEPEAGTAWWFRNDVTHWVNNDSDQDRLSMIVCIKTDMFKGLK